MIAITQFYRGAVQLLARTGLGRLMRGLHSGKPCILTFHGLRADDDEGLLDDSLHTPVSVFRSVCRHLARSYNVVPLSEIVRALEMNEKLPGNSVAITFDDGYESNHALAYPVLREFGLPATIFVTTGFVDGTEHLWFHRLEHAFASAGRDVAAFAKAAQKIKALPQEEVAAEIGRVEAEIGIDYSLLPVKPAIFRPLTWAQIREMHDSGLVEFGGHTHRHLIVGRCLPKTAREEIFTSRNRLAQEVGVAPRLFAYPNGKPGDLTAETGRLLREAGYLAAFSMTPGFVQSSCNRFAIPRYGAPSTLGETEATVSGTFETLKQWRAGTRHAFAAWI
ncbi:MAG: polysaccharide deacetylase family protein [Verrucomicrobiaceae bacterium]|nr:polysaccharide deacetylase family protein [Verrucomicrobiaceae bacterium]